VADQTLAQRLQVELHRCDPHQVIYQDGFVADGIGQAKTELQFLECL